MFVSASIETSFFAGLYLLYIFDMYSSNIFLPTNGLELYCPAAKASCHPLSRIWAGGAYS